MWEHKDHFYIVSLPSARSLSTLQFPSFLKVTGFHKLHFWTSSVHVILWRRCVAKSTPFHHLPTWLPPRRLAAWLHISIPEATVLIAAAPPRQRRGHTVLKYRF
jgi:hypothetical protein